MRIGIDFDNTLVNYDWVFYRAGLQLGWIPESVGTSKSAVKRFFIDNDKEAKWTELQGIVYGRAIADASPYCGVTTALKQLKDVGAQLWVVSHKTRHPIIGSKLDFHQAAQDWLQANGLVAYFEATFFCPEKELKLKQIADLKLDWFVDDLADILQHQLFPRQTRSLHFAPENPDPNLVFARHWQDVPSIVLGSRFG